MILFLRFDISLYYFYAPFRMFVGKRQSPDCPLEMPEVGIIGK